MRQIKKWFNQVKNFSKRKKVFLAVVLLIVVVAWWWRSKASSATTPTYQFAEVKTGSVTQMVSETGEISTSNKTAIVSPATGVVTKVSVSNGQKVTRGTVLFSIKSTATDAERSEATAAYQSAKAAYEQAQASQYSLQSQMFDKWDSYLKKTNEDTFEDPGTDARNLPEFQTTQKDWLAAEQNYKAQTAVLDKAKASLAEATSKYQATHDAQVKATTDGEVMNIAYAEGQHVTAEDTLAVLKTDQDVWVEMPLSENDVVLVKPEQTAVVTIDALNDVTYDAIVKRVDEFGSLDDGVVVYHAYLLVSGDLSAIKPGMTAQVSVTTNQKNDVLVVPTAAIKPYQGKKAVQIWNQSKNAAEYQPVEVGITGEETIEITSGLKVGDRVVIGTATSTSSSNSSGSFLFGRRR